MSEAQKLAKRELHEWGRGHKINEQPRLLPGKAIRSISCGGSHSAALLTDGSVYVWGDGRSGQLGLGTGIKKTEHPLKVVSLSKYKVISVWCGFAQTAVFTDNKLLFIWGFDCFLGPIFEPRKVKKYRDKFVKQIVFGPSTTMILIESKKPFQDSKIVTDVLSYGISDKGVLGLGDSIIEQKEPKAISQLSNKSVSMISVGEFHAAAITLDYDVFIWGANRDETLGTFCGGIIWIPKPVLKLENSKIINIQCGTDCTFAQSSNGELYSWGKGRHGVLGHGNEDDQLFPKKIEKLNSIIGMSTGGMHVIAWLEDGSIYSWGWGRDFKLGQLTDVDKFVPSKVFGISKGKLVINVSCGFDRTLVLLEPNLISVTYKQEVKTISIHSESLVNDIIQQLTKHLRISFKVVLIDSNGNTLSGDEFMKKFTKNTRKFFLIRQPSLWVEQCSELQFEGEKPKNDNDTSIPIISKATKDKLVEWLTHHTGTGTDFVKIFLLMYSNFMTSKELLDKLTERFTSPRLPQFLHESMARGAQRIIQLRVVNILKKWIQGSYIDIMRESDYNLIEEIRQFIESDIQKEHPHVSVSLRRSLTNILGKAQNSDINIEFNDNAPSSYSPEHSLQMNIFKYNPIEFARHLAIIDHCYFFKRIHPNEFLNQAWSKKNKEDIAPNIVATIQRFNNLSQWCAADILRGETPMIRAQIVERLIEIGDECLKIGNLNAVLAIVSCMNSAPICRLRLWFKKNGISSKHISILSKLRDIVSVDGNMANYRNYFENLPSPKIPFLGICLQDLTFLDDANPNYDENNPNLINFSKWIKLGKIINGLVEIQKTPYNYRPIQPLLNYLLSACGFENHESSAYQFSKLIEPDDGLKKSKSTQNILAPSIVSETLTVLYKNADRDKKPLLEEPEIKLLNQRAKLILQNFQGSLEPDRRAFWKSLVNKLAASSSKRHISSHTRSYVNIASKLVVRINRNSDFDCLNFREIIVQSTIIENSIESALLCYPSTNQDIQLFETLLKAIFHPFVNVNEICKVIQELNTFNLIPEYRQKIVDLFCCYKNYEIQSRHSRISNAVRALNRLLSVNDEVLELELDPSDELSKQIEFHAMCVQHMYVQYQILKEKQQEFTKVFEITDGGIIEQLEEFLDDLSKNSQIQVERKMDEKRNLEEIYEEKMAGLLKQKTEEENLLLELELEEKKLLKELDECEKKLDKATRNTRSFSFFSSNAKAQCRANFAASNFLLKKEKFLNSFGNCLKAVHSLRDLFVSQHLELYYEKSASTEKQLKMILQNIIIFMMEINAAHRNLEKGISESDENDELFIYADIANSLHAFTPFICHLLDLDPEFNVQGTKFLESQNNCIQALNTK